LFNTDECLVLLYKVYVALSVGSIFESNRCWPVTLWHFQYNN